AGHIVPRSGPVVRMDTDPEALARPGCLMLYTSSCVERTHLVGLVVRDRPRRRRHGPPGLRSATLRRARMARDVLHDRHGARRLARTAQDWSARRGARHSGRRGEAYCADLMISRARSVPTSRLRLGVYSVGWRAGVAAPLLTYEPQHYDPKDDSQKCHTNDLDLNHHLLS